MAPCRKHQKVKKQDKDGLPYHYDAMTSALVVEFYWVQTQADFSLGKMFVDKIFNNFNLLNAY